MPHITCRVQGPLQVGLEPGNVEEGVPRRIFKEIKPDDIVLKRSLMNASLGIPGWTSGLALSQMAYSVEIKTTTYIALIGIDSLMFLACYYFRDRYQEGVAFFPLSNNTFGQFILLKGAPELSTPRALQRNIEPAGKKIVTIKVNQGESLRCFQEKTIRLIWIRRIKSLASFVCAGSWSYFVSGTLNELENGNDSLGFKVTYYINFSLIMLSLFAYIAAEKNDRLEEYITLDEAPPTLECATDSDRSISLNNF